MAALRPAFLLPDCIGTLPDGLLLTACPSPEEIAATISGSVCPVAAVDVAAFWSVVFTGPEVWAVSARSPASKCVSPCLIVVIKYKADLEGYW